MWKQKATWTSTTQRREDNYQLLNFTKNTPLLSGKKDSSGISDEELIQLYKSDHDKARVGILFGRYSHLVFGVCLKYLKNKDEARDSVINIFEKLFEDLKSHPVENFRAWLHTVTRNYCLMQLRKANRPGTESDVDELSWKLKEEHSEEPVVKEEQLQHMEKAMEKLADEQRKCIDLFYLQEKCYQEVADITGYTLKQVKSYIQNGKRNLKILLSQTHEPAVK